MVGNMEQMKETLGCRSEDELIIHEMKDKMAECSQLSTFQIASAIYHYMDIHCMYEGWSRICNLEFYCSSYIYCCVFSVVKKLHSSALYMMNIFIIGVCKSQILWNH